MNSLDIMALAIVVICGVQALVKGLAAELAELALTIAGLLAALLFYGSIELVLLKLGVGNPLAAMLGFVLIFVAFIILGELGSARIKKHLRKKEIIWRDGFWSVPVGMLRGFVINAVLFLVLITFPGNPRIFGQSFAAPLFLPGSSLILKLAPREFRRLVPDQGEDLLTNPPGNNEDPGNGREELIVPDENRIEKI